MAALAAAVGICTTASAFTLLVPTLLDELREVVSFDIYNEVLFISPLLAVLRGAVAGISAEESIYLTEVASRKGCRKQVEKVMNWKSQPEQVEKAAETDSQKVYDSCWCDTSTSCAGTSC